MVSRDLSARSAALSAKILATWIASPTECTCTVGQLVESTQVGPAFERLTSTMDPSACDDVEVTWARRSDAGHVAGSGSVLTVNGGGTVETDSALMSRVSVCSA